MKNKLNLKNNFLKTVPIMSGYIVLGIGFGIILKSKGFGLLWSFCMGLFIYAGSMQYVAVDLLCEKASLLLVAFTTFMVNARHIFYGISFVSRYKKTGKIKPYLIFGLTDETYSVICSDETLSKTDFFVITMLNHIYWVLGCVLGSVAGTLINFDFKGADFALTALFVCILTEQCLNKKNIIFALTGLISTLFCLFAFGKNNFMIPSMILITIILSFLKKLNKGGENNG